jgi:hypothetical protein
MGQIEATIRSESRVGRYLLSGAATVVLALLLGAYVDCVARCTMWLDQWDECRAREGLLSSCAKLLETTRPRLCGRLVSPSAPEIKTSSSDSGAD